MKYQEGLLGRNYMQPYAFIWDLDGTLVDSYTCIVPKVKELFAKSGVRYSEDYIKNYVLRYSVGKLLDEAAPLVGKDPVLLKEQFAILNDQGISGIGPMPYATEVLEKLTKKGHYCFIYTHRGDSCQSILKQNGLDPYFTEIVTVQAGFPRKPAPDGILYLLKKYNLSPDHCFYVGDRSIDIESGNNAGIGTILFLPEGNPVVPDGTQSYIIHDLREIEGIVESLN